MDYAITELMVISNALEFCKINAILTSVGILQIEGEKVIIITQKKTD